MASGPRTAHAIVVPLVLAALCLFIYLPGIGNEFVWDDEEYLTGNPAVTGGLTAAGAAWAARAFHGGNWHPLTWVSHMADWTLFGPDPRGHHLVNLGLHAANAGLTFALFAGLTGALWPSAAVAALFAVHPLHVESVSWAAERKDVLSTAFWLAALLAWTGWARGRRPATYLAALSLFSAALAAKAMPVTLPFQLLLLDFWPLGRVGRIRAGTLLREKIPFLLLASAAGAVAWAAQSGAGAVGAIPLPLRLGNALESYLRYLGKAVWPAHLAVFYPFPPAAPPTARVACAVALLAGVTAVVLLLRRRLPAAVFGWLWYLGTLVPVIGLVQVGAQAMADRYTYVPLTGVFVMVAWGAGGLVAGRPGRGARRGIAAALCVACVAALAARAGAQVRIWKDPFTLFTHALGVAPDNPLVHFNLGSLRLARGECAAAAAHYRAGLALWPDRADARCHLGEALTGAGDVAGAIPEYEAAIRLNPGLAEAYNNVGMLLGRSPRTAASGEWRLRQALAIRPDFPQARSNLGQLLAAQGRTAEAIPHLREAVRLSPATASYREDLAAAISRLERIGEPAAVREDSRPALAPPRARDPVTQPPSAR